MSLIVVLGAAACVDDGGVTETPPTVEAFVDESRDVQAAEGVASDIAGPIRPRCMVTGCSGQVCANQPVYTTCEWREEYACYDDAICTVQADGNCGWTQTPELLACLASGGGVAM